MVLDLPARLCLSECQAVIDSLVCVSLGFSSPTLHLERRNLTSAQKERQPQGSNYSLLKNDVITERKEHKVTKNFSCVFTAMELLCTQYMPAWPHKVSLSPEPMGGFISEPFSCSLKVKCHPTPTPRLMCLSTQTSPHGNVWEGDGSFWKVRYSYRK